MDLSIIIPLYNCENYLPLTFRVLESQELFHNKDINAEIILVDDGSMDNTLSLAKIFQSERSNVTVISNSHKGLSETRNIGLKNSTGKYVYFMDCDDVLYPGCLKYFLKIALKKEPEILIFGKENISEHDIEPIFSNPKCAKNDFRITFEGNSEKYILQTSYLIGQDCIWHKFFKKDFINLHNFKFDTNLIFAEDTLFTWQTIALSSHILYVNFTGYFYVIRPQSYFHSAVKNTSRWKESKLQQQYLALSYHNFIKEHPALTPNIKDSFKIKQHLFIFGYWAFILRKGICKDEMKELLKTQYEAGIYPITTQYRSIFFEKGIKNYIFRALWIIVSNEFFLNAAMTVRNFQLKLLKLLRS